MRSRSSSTASSSSDDWMEIYETCPFGNVGGSDELSHWTFHRTGGGGPESGLITHQGVWRAVQRTWGEPWSINDVPNVELRDIHGVPEARVTQERISGWYYPPGAPTFTCSVCAKQARGWGNNPRPLFESGSCCDKCNAVVVFLRIAQMRREPFVADEWVVKILQGHPDLAPIYETFGPRITEPIVPRRTQ